jgi:hypothetical protein
MENDYWDHQRFRRSQILCAWAIVLALATIFGIESRLWRRNQPALFSVRVAAMEEPADMQQSDGSQRNEDMDDDDNMEEWRTRLAQESPEQASASGAHKIAWLLRVDR